MVNIRHQRTRLGLFFGKMPLQMGWHRSSATSDGVEIVFTEQFAKWHFVTFL